MQQQPQVIQHLVYLDGATHVRASVAMDYIATTVASRREVVHAYLGSPAMPYTISAEAHLAASQRHAEKSILNRILRLQSNALPEISAQTEAGEVYTAYVTDGVVNFQGPNYALAKTIQMWRAVLARASGQRVSLNMAPPSRTHSVQHSASAAAALEGMAWFPPNLGFDPTVVSSAMMQLLLFDLMAPNSSSDPACQLRHPYDLFWDTAFHGGAPRCGFKTESIGSAAYMFGKAGYSQSIADP